MAKKQMILMRKLLLAPSITNILFIIIIENANVQESKEVQIFNPIPDSINM